MARYGKAARSRYYTEWAANPRHTPVMQTAADLMKTSNKSGLVKADGRVLKSEPAFAPLTIATRVCPKVLPRII